MKFSKIKVLILALLLPAISWGNSCSFGAYIQMKVGNSKAPVELLETVTERFRVGGGNNLNACQGLLQQCQREMREIFSNNTCKLRKIKKNTCYVDLLQESYWSNKPTVIHTYTKSLAPAGKNPKKLACAKAKRKCKKAIAPFSGMPHYNSWCKRLK